MGKPKSPRRVAPNEALAVARRLRISPRKLGLVAAMIRGMEVGRALVVLEFCRKKAAPMVRKTLESAIANAENNHGLDIDRLYVAEASVGKSLVLKRFRPRARGRVGRILKPYSQLRIVVREREEAA